jgi:anthranilate synthase component 1
VIPVFERCSGLTDLLALHRQAPADFPFLLQSAVADAGAHANARYDVLFAYPDGTLLLDPEQGLSWNGQNLAEEDFLAVLDTQWRNAAQQRQSLPDLPFSGGWFLYLGYELAAQIETRLCLPHSDPATTISLPVAAATRIPAAIINDHASQATILVAETADALARLRAQARPLPPHQPLKADSVQVDIQEDPAEAYLQQVARVKRYIVDGDVFQVNLSRGWQGKARRPVDAAQLYARLCRSNPAPFAGLACYADGNIISSSPERLLRVRNRIAETRPIAGTRPRSTSTRDDAALKRELIGHPKERAEHIMLIDLERNDLGRICQPGSIEVNELMVLESYAHVHHIVSNVRGMLRDEVTPGEAIRAVFPGGTITGCPKERCMAIIAELEQTPRGAYTGSMGYLNHNGDLDLNILIRTITCKDTQICLRAGAGLVADSVAERELDETRHKARGMLLALEGEA